MKILILMVFASAQMVMANGGHSVGNGGDSLVIDFQNVATEIFQNWMKTSAQCEVNLSLNPQKFYAIVVTTKIESTDQPLFLEENGNVVLKEAVNYPLEARIVFNRTAYKNNTNKKQFVLHEFLGILGIPDINYAMSKAILDITQVANCSRYSSFDDRYLPKNIKATIYTSVEVGDDGIVYILNKANNAILRYNLRDGKYLPPLDLRFKAKKIRYSEEAKRLYINNTQNTLSYFDLSNFSQEKVFLRMDESIGDFLPIGKFIVMSVYGDHYYIYDMDGVLSQSSGFGSALSYTENLFWDSYERNLYYISRGSPVDIQRIKIENGKFVKTGKYSESEDSPYHGDYAFKVPIIIGEKMLALGSNQALDKKTLRFQRGVYAPFDVGAWSNSNLVIGVPKELHYELIVLDSNVSEQSITQVPGEIIKIFVWQNRFYYMYVPVGTVNIEIVAI